MLWPSAPQCNTLAIVIRPAFMLCCFCTAMSILLFNSSTIAWLEHKILQSLQIEDVCVKTRGSRSMKGKSRSREQIRRCFDLNPRRESSPRFREQRERTPPYFWMDLIKVQFNYNANSFGYNCIWIWSKHSGEKCCKCSCSIISVLLQQNFR